MILEEYHLQQWYLLGYYELVGPPVQLFFLQQFFEGKYIYA